MAKVKKSELARKFLSNLRESDVEEYKEFGVSELCEMFAKQTGEVITYSQLSSIQKAFDLRIENPELYAQEVQAEEIDEEIRIVKMNDEVKNLDPSIFIPLASGKSIDRIISNEGGPMKAAVTMVIGDPGSGKSTILADLLAAVETHNDEEVRTLYIQGEQTIIDAAYAFKYAPATGNVNNIFLNQYSNPRRALEKVLDEGWDIIVMDSFADISSRIQEVTKMSGKQVESYMVNLMIKVGEGANKRGKFTSFFCIQQVTKGGDFAGSNTIKHATTAMMEVRIDKKNTDDRYVMFTKNRRCGGLINQKLYFTLNKESGQIEYNAKRFDDMLATKEKVAEELDRLEESKEEFSSFFNTDSAAFAGSDIVEAEIVKDDNMAA